MGTKNIPGRFDCYHAAAPDEPLFVLLARDPSAPALVEAWARMRALQVRDGIKPASDQAKIDEAMACAAAMEDWQRRAKGEAPPAMPQHPRLGLLIGFTGTQHGMTQRQRLAFGALLAAMPAGEFHHGDCVGADEQAHDIAKALGAWRTVLHPPENGSKRAYCVADNSLEPLPYLERNRAIVGATACLIAAPREHQEEQRSGTWSTVRYARRLERPLAIILPDGTCERSNGF